MPATDTQKELATMKISMTTRMRNIAAIGAAMLALSLPQNARAAEFSTPQKSEFEKRQAAGEAEKHQAAVKENAMALFSSPRQVVVGNPQGNVTFVEFFDYNCGYCKRAMSDMFTHMKEDPKLKVVLKEFPVLGPGSVEAAQVAVAVRMQDKTGQKLSLIHI